MNTLYLNTYIYFTLVNKSINKEVLTEKKRTFLSKETSLPTQKTALLFFRNELINGTLALVQYIYIVLSLYFTFDVVSMVCTMHVL